MSREHTHIFHTIRTNNSIRQSFSSQNTFRFFLFFVILGSALRFTRDQTHKCLRLCGFVVSDVFSQYISVLFSRRPIDTRAHRGGLLSRRTVHSAPVLAFHLRQLFARTSVAPPTCSGQTSRCICICEGSLCTLESALFPN